MVKAGLLTFGGRRKSQSNVLDEVKPFPAAESAPVAEAPSGGAGGGGFRLMSTSEAEARKTEEKRRAHEKSSSKFRPFSSFSAGNKARNRSFDEDSPGSSKRYADPLPAHNFSAHTLLRDSKSSSGTQSSRPYNNGQFGSTSTLPSSADTDPSDNIFAVPRPHLSQHSNSHSGMSTNGYKKELPAVPQTGNRYYGGEPTSPVGGVGRVRAMTSSSYASTAKPPTLDADMNFGATSFDDLFSGLDRKPSPEHATETPGRSLLAGKRTFHAEPIKIDHKLDVEAPLKSWDSRGSADNLMSSSRSEEDDSPPPPVPPHKYGQYAPVASYSPDVELSSANDYLNNDASIARQSAMSHKSHRESSPEHDSISKSSSSAPSLQTPLSSRSGSDIATPKAALRSGPSHMTEHDLENEDIFTSPKQKQAPKPAIPAPKEQIRPPPPTTDSGRRVLTQAEFRAQQQRAMAQPHDDSSEEEDYEDEEEAQERAAQEAIARRKKQQMDLARDHMRRTTTAPGTLTRPDSTVEPFSMGFPSETSLQADEWEDEDIPLGILAQHGFPNKNQGKAPIQPANATPSYFPDRPASAGAAGDNRASAFRPVFARHLPDDPHASFIGGGLIRQTNRESLGFNNRGPASVAGDSHMNVPMMNYPDSQMGSPSLVEQIHMRDMSKKKFMGGASPKVAEGPFTGMLGAQMNPPVQSGPGTRMSMMPGMQNMNVGMNMGMMGSPMGMPMMPGQMSYPMQPNDMMQMQQMQQMQQLLAAQQMQIQQMQQMQQDPRMSMAFPPSMSDPRMSMAFPQMQQHSDPRMSLAAPSFLNIPTGGAQPQRPMSIMPVANSQTPMQPPRPYSTPLGASLGAAPQLPGYTPSIAPSERSNVGLSARYRPVATHTDAKSSSSMTMTMSMQAGGGAAQGQQQVKGILKKGSAVQEEEDEGWGKMAARKGKFGGQQGAQNGEPSLKDLVRGMEGL
ncbi:hypothetical protein GRF29_1536g128085 [Pseudopithomyces chartarum]|uniref:Med15 multi-domain protein n=1 Tax=Pseudopithomyces chartarum TaxID=1892770 RepID=A0AAN6LKP9_9PLEO|nr:hypothetical protein GRF29_1536g128085 [Pseudopithomyces chartarum]